MSSNTVSDILSLIKQLDINTCFDIFVPSLQKEIKFKQLTTEQLKKILKTLLDSPINNQDFILTFNSIIKENCITPEINTDNLTILDKQIILLKTRIESISPEYIFNITDDIKQTITLNSNLEKFLTKKTNLTSETFTSNNCSLICSLPTLEIENKFEKELRQNIKQNVSSSEDLKNIIGETFINEITKFVSSITINDTVIDLSTYNFKDRIKVVETLPTTLVNNVIKYIEKYRDIVKELFSCNITIDGQDTVIQRELPQDASFFNLQ